MTARTYSSALAFKAALEQRLKNEAADAVALSRKRQLVVFDRFLARLAKVFADALILKGGLVLEIRLQRARTTKDIDIRLSGNPDGLLEQLQEAGRLDQNDFMTFEVVPDKHPTILNEGMQYQGYRYRVECRIAGKLYGRPFGLDVAYGDALVGRPDVMTAENRLSFADIAPPSLRLYPIETHIAEKLHAYTLPRTRENSRVKDLPDIALLGTIREVHAHNLLEAVKKTFAMRATHPIPSEIPAPPSSWEQPYARMAAEDDLLWKSVDAVTDAVAAFLDPLLAGIVEDLRWDPMLWTWE